MCSCQAGKVKGVETEEWGPHYWKLLHKLSLKAGTLTDSNGQAEEMRLWVRIFRETGKAIPCEDCRNHYKDWLLANPIKPFQDLPYSEKGEWIRNWWWALHSDVNRRTQKSNIDFSELAVTYASVFTRFEIATIEKYNGKACLASQVKLFDFKEWKKAAVFLNSLYY